MMKTDRVELLIDGKSHSNWEKYEIDSNLMIPADAWSVALGMSGGQVPPSVVEGAPVVVKLGGDIVLTGYIDEISQSISKTSHTLTISGRDLAADLLDCSAPIITRMQSSLKEIIAAIISEFKKTKIRIDADLTHARKKNQHSSRRYGMGFLGKRCSSKWLMGLVRTRRHTGCWWP